MRKESTTQIIVPPIVFALVVHFVFQKVFMVDLSIPWLFIVLGFQSAMFTAWAFEKTPGFLTITGAALSALVIDGFVAVRGITETGNMTSLTFLGAGLSSLLIVAALYTSYQLATSPGFWFAHNINHPYQSGRPVSADGTSPGKTASSPATQTSSAPQPTAVKAGPKPGVTKMNAVFRIHHALTGQLILTCPCEQMGQHLHIKSLKGLLVDYDPDTVVIVQITWTSDTVVDIHVEGELKGSGKDHYTLLEFED